MIEINGNFWEYPAQYYCVTTNGIVKNNGELVMGAGIALEAKNRFPQLPQRLGKLVSIFGNKAFFLQDLRIISFPTKHHFKDNSDIKLIENSAKEIAAFVKIHQVESIVMTRPGCGHGKLNWKDVKNVIEPIFSTDQFIVISR